MNGDRSPQPWRPRGPLHHRSAQPEPSQVIRRENPPPRPPGRPRPEPDSTPATTDPPPSSTARPVRLRRQRGPAESTPPPRPVAPKARRNRVRRRRWGRIVALSVLVVLLLAGAGILGGALWLDTSLRREPVFSDDADRPGAGRGTNWLLVGSDSRQDLTTEQQQSLATGGDVGAGRTDTILLVHVPEFGSSTPTTLVSIPRDSSVPIPGHGRDKINAAFVTGGAPLLVQTVEQATGLRVNHYAEVGFGGFADLVDALGGVSVCLSDPIRDPLAGVDLPVGCQQLDGRRALGYVRSRATPRADLDRMLNQRQFMAALLHRAASPAVWLNPWRWYAVPHAAARALTVDQATHVFDLARLVWALHGHTTALTVPIGEFTDSDVGSVVVWNHDAARELFDALASDAPVPTSAIDGQP
ncbi:LCP family protein [Mycobacterium persicum]|uniref:LCP family protein n=1 Tax=Mycobacterium persicum TaxID=1487726 RepID=UPI000A0A9FD1|nr:LCP family protein [Mycobacterium persicum]ORB90113.1 LytTR family transcriptional regulator [Mycobacterium persicum]